MRREVIGGGVSGCDWVGERCVRGVEGEHKCGKCVYINAVQMFIVNYI